MTLRHKIKLIFCRITWWLRITNEAKKHYKILEDYKYLFNLYEDKKKEYLLEHKRKIDSIETIQLKAQVELLATILDINS